jgi:protein gp37
MPDGKIAVCYAEEVAEKWRGGYPDGFASHYWRPHMLKEPGKLKEPSRIFMDSMSDLMGHWVPADQIETVFETVRSLPQHQFQMLTKNPRRIREFDFPENVWVGASSPPDFMFGKELNRRQQIAMMDRTLKCLAEKQNVRWMSIEPLSWDVSGVLDDNQPLDWVVIGAATHGRTVYQVDPDILTKCLEVLDAQHVPVFFKGNIWGNPAITRWREYFPGFQESEFMGLNLGNHAIPIPS